MCGDDFRIPPSLVLLFGMRMAGTMQILKQCARSVVNHMDLLSNNEL